MRINLRVIRGIILVRGGSFVDRRQIYARYPKIPDIVQLIDNALQIAAEKFLVAHSSLHPPGKRPFRVDGRVAVTEPLRENLIPDRVVDPCGCHRDIRRVHPGHDKALPASARQRHLRLGHKAVLKIKPPLVLRLQFKIIFQTLKFGPDGRGPPELVFQTFLERDIQSLTVPALPAAKNSRLKGIPVNQIHILYVISRPDVDDKLLLVERIAVIVIRPVIHRIKVHKIPSFRDFPHPLCLENVFFCPYRTTSLSKMQAFYQKKKRLILVPCYSFNAASRHPRCNASPKYCFAIRISFATPSPCSYRSPIR